jgi:hypothetical protein
LQQGSAKIKLIISSLTALAKDLMTGEETVLNTASEMAELLNEDYKDEDMNEEKWLKALLENVSLSPELASQPTPPAHHLPSYRRSCHNSKKTSER